MRTREETLQVLHKIKASFSEIEKGASLEKNPKRKIIYIQTYIYKERLCMHIKRAYLNKLKEIGYMHNAHESTYSKMNGHQMSNYVT